MLDLVRDGRITLLFDERILAEYREVLARDRFQFEPADVAQLIADLETIGERVEPTRLAVVLPDPDDAPFLEVAISGRADALVTGNIKHYPTGLGVPIFPPAHVIRQATSR